MGSEVVRATSSSCVESVEFVCVRGCVVGCAYSDAQQPEMMCGACPAFALLRFCAFADFVCFTEPASERDSGA